MAHCMYTAQGELICQEHFIRSGTRPHAVEGFRNINYRPNEPSGFVDPSMIVNNETISMAIERGCSINIDKDKGLSITCSK